ncbi:hypothetical protein ACLMJK_006379 [Lecanora helva]
MPPKPPSTTKPKSTYIETDTGNKVARRNQLIGTQHIILAGRSVIEPDVCIRGDLVRTNPSSSTTTTTTPDPSNPSNKPPQQQQTQYTASVTIGRYTIISRSTLLKPPSRLHSSHLTYSPLKIGDHTLIGPNCVIEAASIGNNVTIGEGAVVGKMCIVKDWARVLEGSVVPMGAVVGSGVVVGGRPARVVGDVGDGWGAGEGEGGDLRGLVRGYG